MRIATRALKDTVGAASAMGTNELTVKPSENGWAVRMLSPAHTHVMDVVIPAGIFTDYTVGERFAVGTERLAKALASCGQTVDVEVTDRIRLVSDGIKVTIPLVEPEEEQAMKPIEGYTSSVTIPLDVIRRMSDAAPDKAMSVRVIVNADGVVMDSREDDGVNGTSLDIPADDCIVCDGESNSMYAWSMLREFLKAAPRGLDVTVRMGDDFPMEITFETAEGVRGTFMLAPWIAEE